MVNNGEEYLKFYKGFRNYNLYQLKTDIEGKKYKQLVANSRMKNLWFCFGKKSLGDFKDKTLNYLIFDFLKRKFDEEKSKKNLSECTHLDIRGIYRKSIFWNYVKVSIIFYFLPFIYLFSSNMRKFGIIRFAIFVPYLFSIQSLISMVNEYNLKKNSVLYLFAIEKLYNRDCDHKKIYEDYIDFIKEHKLVFINEKV